MNLHQIVSGSINAINPAVVCSLRISTGSSTRPDGTRSPTYALIPNVTCQIQPLSSSDLRHLDGLNLTGIHKSVYIGGSLSPVDRARLSGGDLLTLPDGSLWLIAQVLESWPDWTHAVVTLQNS